MVVKLTIGIVICFDSEYILVYGPKISIDKILEGRSQVNQGQNSDMGEGVSKMAKKILTSFMNINVNENVRSAVIRPHSIKLCMLDIQRQIEQKVSSHHFSPLPPLYFHHLKLAYSLFRGLKVYICKNVSRKEKYMKQWI